MEMKKKVIQNQWKLKNTAEFRVQFQVHQAFFLIRLEVQQHQSLIVKNIYLNSPQGSIFGLQISLEAPLQQQFLQSS